MSSKHEPTTWSRDTGQQIPCFDRCLLIITLKLKFAAYDCAYASFPWKINRYSYGVQFGINCTALDQSKLSNFVECTIKMEIVTRQWGRDRGSELSIFPTYIAVVIWCFGITKYLKGGKIFHLYFSVSFNLGIMSVIMMSHHLFSQLPKSSQSIPCLLLVASSAL